LPLRYERVKNLTVITNAVNIAAELSATTLDVILTGGTLRKNSFSLVGPIAKETLRHLNTDILFLGIDGFDVRYGLSTPNLPESESESGYGRNCQAKNCSMRFQQIWAAQPIVDSSDLGTA
jgi:DeoR/GlpR family transcriptional regulator of sugar metabolism